MCTKFVVIPQTFNRELLAVKFPYRDLTNVKALLSILSVKDVSFFLYVQQLFAEVGFEAITKTLDRADWIMEDGLCSSFNDSSRVKESNLWKEMDGYRMQNPTRSLRPAYDGLFSTESGGNKVTDYIYEFKEVNEDTIAVVLTPIDKEKPEREQLHRSVDKLLAILAKYRPVGELAKTFAFRAFAELSVPIAFNG